LALSKGALSIKYY